MTKRNLRIITHDCPFIGVCEACNKQFRSYRIKRIDAEHVIKSKFGRHECGEEDFNQAVRIVTKAE